MLNKLDDDEHNQVLDTLALCLQIEPKLLKLSMTMRELGTDMADLNAKLNTAFNMRLPSDEVWTNVNQIVLYIERHIENGKLRS
jgi:hypothetical protein